MKNERMEERKGGGQVAGGFGGKASSPLGREEGNPCVDVRGRDAKKQDVGYKMYGAPGNKGESSGGMSKDKYQNEGTVEPSNYYHTSSIYYGGQEHYSTTTESPNNFKKDSDDDDPNGNNPNKASRGNWWQGRTQPKTNT
ncbi:store-operated calcium entry-associated regulatory factor [Senna tora]|uniref:Store-operated calcium entry-associated regulatory factor n=1 Tax=Senna tora TaxID=362788 RepID=A0A834WR75_9FABA|nr:store-operated calcium entry-associated regulatory factor [Senna tora]